MPCRVRLCLDVSTIWSDFDTRKLSVVCDQARHPTSSSRLTINTPPSAKKKGKGGGNSEGAQPRERKEKDDVIEVIT